MFSILPKTKFKFSIFLSANVFNLVQSKNGVLGIGLRKQKTLSLKATCTCIENVAQGFYCCLQSNCLCSECVFQSFPLPFPTLVYKVTFARDQDS